MLSPELMPVAISLLATVCAGGVLFALFYSHIKRRSERHRRFAAIVGAGPAIDRSAASDSSRRRKAVELTLKEIDDKQKLKKASKTTLVGRMRQAGMTWSAKGYYVACTCTATVSFIGAIGAFRIGPLPSLGFATAGGLLLPHLYINAKRAQRFRQFTAEFPNAVDIIVRGIKAGLPLADCMRIISTEAQEPVRSEFRAILEDQTMGVPIDQAVQRLPERIPLPESTFFAIVIALQSRTGGSLAEALGNLSKVLRERKKMKAKVKAVSSEAKVSAGIIGSLPFIVAGLVYLTAPAYISLLFSTTIGHMVMGASAFWMMIGVLVMRKMINFDF